MEARTHQPLLRNGKSYLTQYSRFEKITTQPNEASAGGFKPGKIVDGFTRDTEAGNRLVARFKDEQGLASAFRYRNDKTGKETVGVHEIVLGGQEQVGTVTDRLYSDEGGSIRVDERFSVVEDANGGSLSLSTFTVDKTTGAIAVLE